MPQLTAVQSLAHGDGKADLADLERGAGLQRPTLAASERFAVERGAVGRAEILDLQDPVGQGDADMASRHRRMRQYDVALIDVAADDHIFALPHQPVEIDVEAVLAAGPVGAAEAQ